MLDTACTMSVRVECLDTAVALALAIAFIQGERGLDRTNLELTMPLPLEGGSRRSLRRRSSVGATGRQRIGVRYGRR